MSASGSEQTSLIFNVKNGIHHPITRLKRRFRVCVRRSVRKRGFLESPLGPGLVPSGSCGPFGRAVRYEGLAGCDSVDAAYLLNGLFQEFLLAVGPEGRQNVERSRYDVCLCKVGDGLQLLQDSRESSSNLQQCEGQWAVAVGFVGAVGDALEGDGCLGVRDAREASDLFHGAVGLARLVGA